MSWRAEIPNGTGRGVRIAVIDSGIAAGHPHIGAVAGGTALVEHPPFDHLDRIGHGTAVAAAIREKVPDADLLSVRVFEQSLATSARTLCAAIDWAADHGAHLVNLSVGTTNEAHRALFATAIARARERGAVVVAAAADRAVELLPGRLAGVIGVMADPECDREELRVVSTDAGMRLVCSPQPRPIDGVPVERNLSGVSFAVANATGLLARVLEADPTTDLLAWMATEGSRRG